MHLPLLFAALTSTALFSTALFSTLISTARASDPPAPGPPAAAISGAELGLPVDYRRPALGGGELDLATFKGKPLLLNLWASWCPPCLQELPQLQLLQEAWAPRGLQLVGLAIDDQPARVALRVKEQAISWPIALDSSTTAAPAFGTSELPTTVLYDAQGRRVWSHRGPISASDVALLQALEGLLPAG